MDAITPENLKTMFEHGVRQYPQECCGMLFSNGGVHQATNIQQQLHEQNPEVYERGADMGYAFSISDIKLLANSFETPNPAVVIYHSHPDVGAYFSEEDKSKALFCGEPVYPVSYLVLDIRKGAPFGAKLFHFFDSDFHCTETFDEEGRRVNQLRTMST
ncbi:Mov34/MPN/PAD-1 family protein [Halomonas sp. G11]|uniref:Mov34/MPN/PAD-1 family protein n=1 Tax=Halomonas sp. G11 TaxID=1684425 RepID=UPI000A89FEE2|nr:Mov34/MPN/PAD-1 family protein [Halomonas sp. G11]